MLLLALPLLTTALQLSHREVGNWLLPNIDIPISQEASWNWSCLCCYFDLSLLPLCCCIQLRVSRTVAPSIALPQISAPKHYLAASLHFAPINICHSTTIVRGCHSQIWSKSLGTSRILPLVCSPHDYNSMSPHLFSRGAWALMEPSSSVLTFFSALAGAALELEASPLFFFLGH